MRVGNVLENVNAEAVWELCANKLADAIRCLLYTSPATMEEAHADIEEAIKDETGLYFKADTLEELANKMGVDQEGFLETIREYNQYCQDGFDWGVYKPENALVPFTEGPYYAMKGHMLSLIHI